ncbi:hypothetical protein PG996_000018 [Apiospora saccharicola]|uniref:Uncharacterized protein n=1 Tax=Apiospora saccharicola TaxID=335842 RepID=A0ABR1WCS7_9PEZI
MITILILATNDDGNPDCTRHSNEAFDLAPPQDLRPFSLIPLSVSVHLRRDIDFIFSRVPRTTSPSQPAAPGGSSSSSSTRQFGNNRP